MSRTHLQQPYGSWGCQHHAMYNLFGNPALLRDPTNETSQFRFQRWCRQLGYEFLSLYYDATLAYPTPRHYWKELFSSTWRRASRGQRSAMVLDIIGAAAGTLHTVGVVIYTSASGSTPSVGFTVHDSRLPQALEYFTLAEFQDSPYASAYAAFMVADAASMEANCPSQPGHEQSWADGVDKANYAEMLRTTATYCPICHAPDCDH